MNSIIKNVLALIVGIGAGSFVNISLVNLGPMVIPLPEGADVTTMEGLQESMPILGPKHFFFPFLGHALGTFCGAFVAAKMAASHSMKLALGVGGFFLVGGITMVLMLKGPMWYNITDLLLAYLPMAILGGRIAIGKRQPTS